MLEYNLEECPGAGVFEESLEVIHRATFLDKIEFSLGNVPFCSTGEHV